MLLWWLSVGAVLRIIGPVVTRPRPLSAKTLAPCFGADKRVVDYPRDLDHHVQAFLGKNENASGTDGLFGGRVRRL